MTPPNYVLKSEDYYRNFKQAIKSKDTFLSYETGKPCKLGKELHLKISKAIAENLRNIADILDHEN